MSETPSFAQLSLPSSILDTLQELGYEIPTPIQEEAIPFILEGKDLIGQAQTGTGKTAAFALPLLAGLDLKRKSPQVLVLAPTRELAIQVAEAFQTYARHLEEFHVLPIYGGQGYEFQLKGLKRGTHVIVGTPGRVLDHLNRGSLKIGKLSAVVLDEADEMLRMGFIEDVEKIISDAPEDCQMTMFSATMPAAVKRIAKRYLKDPHEIKIASKTTTVESVDQRFLFVNNNQKVEALTRLLEVEEYDGVLIFVRTKSATVEVAEKLEARGFAASALNGDMNQSSRERTVNRLKEKKLDIVVATDVAARGLDVDRLSLVINYDVPYDIDSYVHRIGRTGRAGRGGKTILFLTPREKYLLRSIERATKQKIDPIQLPTNQDLERKRVNLFKEQIVHTFAHQPLNFFRERLDELKQELNVSLEELAPVLLYLAQKEQPLQVKESQPQIKKHSKKESSKESKEKKSRKGKTGKKRKSASDVEYVCYRLEVGVQHKVKTSDIVGAIANEVDIDGQYIGQIKIYDDYSTVELPKGMPKEILHHLRKVHVRKRKLNLSLLKD